MSEFINLSISKENEFYSNKFRTHGKIISVNFNYNPSKKLYDIIDILEEIEDKFEYIFTTLISEYDDDDQIRISLKHDDLDFDIFIPYRLKRFLKVDNIMNEIIKVSQSKREFLLSGNLRFFILSVRIPRIGGNFIETESWLKKSTKVVRMPRDNLCLAKSIYLSICHHNKVDKQTWKRLLNNSNNCLTNEALNLYKKSNIILNEYGVSLNSIKKLQDYFINEFQLIAVSVPDIIIYSGPYNDKQIYIMINKDKTHADCLLSIKPFLKCKYFCKYCIVGFQNKDRHICKNRCKCCLSNKPCIKEFVTYCIECNRNFISKKCFDLHIKNNICKIRKKCLKCNNILNKNHKCGKKNV